MVLKFCKSEYVIIILAVFIKTVLHLIADYNSGFDGDELLYINAGKHLALGYMEAPPLIGVLAFLQNLVHSESVFVHHFFVHIASAVILVLCGLMTIKLGGSWKAVLLVMLILVLAPAFGITHNSFQPVIFDQLFWVLCFYLLVCYISEYNDKYLIYLGIAAAFGFLAKYSMVFFIGALFLSIVFLKPQLFKTRVLWISVLLFLIIITPNIYWQWINGFPVIDHFKALSKLISKETAFGNAAMFFVTLNPFAAPIWLSGVIIVPFSKEFQRFRLLSFTVLFSIVFFIIAKGRFYYLFPAAMVGLCLGSVYIEKSISHKKWIFTSYAMILALSGLALVPYGLPVLPLEQFLKISGQKKREDGRIPMMFEARYTRVDWIRLTEAVHAAFEQLSEDEKRTCLILGSDYTQTSVINFFREKYGLPEAISFHSSYYSWVPEFPAGITMIAIGNTHLVEEYGKWIPVFEQLFDKVEVKSHLFCPYARFDQNACFHIYICRGMKYDSKGFKQIYHDRIFE